MFIYKISNNINDKVYIGQTIGSLKGRFDRHCRLDSKCRALSGAIQKHGPENFWIEEIGGANSLGELDYQEWLLIHQHNCIAPNGYNLKEGGGNKKLSKETKERLSKINLGKKLSDETRAKISKSSKGRRHTEEATEKMSKSNKGKTVSKECKLRLASISKAHWSCDSKKLEMAKTKGACLFYVYRVIKYTGIPKRKCFNPKEYEYTGSWINQQQCARDLGLKSKHINSCLSGKGKFHNMYFFSKEEK